MRSIAVALALAGAFTRGAAADEPPAKQSGQEKPEGKEAPKTEPPPQAPLNFDLLGEPAPGVRVDQAALARRRTMLQIHQGLGLGMFAVTAANVVIGQLNYSDKFASGPNTEKYQMAHQITAYSTLVLFTATGLLAVFAPTPLPRSPGFDRTTLHKIAMGTAAAGMAAEAVLGIWTRTREGYLNQPDLATAHLIIGYATFAAMSVGLGAIVF
jgi:hypothetical protein